MMTVVEMIEKTAMEINLHADRLQIEANNFRRSAAYSKLALENKDTKTAVKMAHATLMPIYEERRIGSLTKNERILMDELDRVMLAFVGNEDDANFMENDHGPQNQ